MKFCGLTWRLIFAAMALIIMPLQAADNDGQKDIRILIDISGSMRQNDPNNLRRPALRMMVGLMPLGTESGVWTFARWVNMLVEHGKIDAAWKDKAVSLSKQISSPGQFTNIEEVLDKATRSWKGDVSNKEKHLLLLTDGMVDISKDPAESAASRKRILEDLLPRIKGYQAKIHTIALSERADHELMKKLAADTGGWYRQINEADQLQKVFFKIFEKVGKPDTVPLKGNRFRIDKSIREATVLVFRKLDAKETRLAGPGGISFNASRAPANISWHSDIGYDLITIKDPEPGEWTLEAEIDNDNRVLVVTDIRLKTSKLPNQLAIGEMIPMSSYLMSEGKQITEKNFLKLIKMTATLNIGETQSQLDINDAGKDPDETANDGRYTLLFGQQDFMPELQLIFAAHSSTFVRERRHSMSVLEPVSLEIEKDDKGQQQAVIYIEPSVVQENGLMLEAWQESEAGIRQDIKLVESDDNRWIAPLSDTQSAVHARFEATSRVGNLLQRELGPVFPEGVTPPVLIPPEPVMPPAEIPVEPPKAESPPEPQPPVDQQMAPPEPLVPGEGEEENGIMLPLLFFGGINLLLIGGGLAIWLVLRKRKAEEIALLEDDDEDEDEIEELGSEFELNSEVEVSDSDDLKPKKGEVD